MPKTPSTVPPSSQNHRELVLNNAAQAGVLKRNQACHQCRKRKLKCDAKRPCSTCVRSHNHAVTHAGPDTVVSPFPDCTFDEVRDAVLSPSEAPRSKYEKLENRINELEALLQQKDSETPPLSNDQTTYPNEYSMADPDFHNSSNDFSSEVLGNTSISYGSPSAGYTNTIPSLNSGPSHITSGSPETGNQLVWSSSPNLPEPSLLKHLVEVFFAYHPYSNRLLHRNTFLHNLSLPFTHPRFPSVAVLHAICALSSNYTNAVTSPPTHAGPQTDEIFSLSARVKELRPDSFAERQAYHAKELIDVMTSLGENILESLQALIILNWYYWAHAKWVEVFIGAGRALRSCVPLGLNMCPPFHSIQESVRFPSILSPPKNVIEDELRRNAFYLSYALERQQGFGNGWATALDDSDVTQLLPVRGDHFDKGLLVLAKDRQWFHGKDILVNHPEDQTDAFSLMIKSCFLLSKIKNFNLRYRAQFYAGNPTVVPDENVTFCGFKDPSSGADPRAAPAFIELDHLLSTFKSSFPSHLRHPITNNVVDVHLYSACLAPLVGMIVLHEPHAKIKQSGCVSAYKVLASARQILNLIYAIWSTSFDVSLLDLFCTFSWYTCGRIFAKFIQAAQEANTPDHVSTLKTELQSVQVALAKMGERIPLAYRYHRMLEDFAVQLIGETTLSQIVTPDAPAFFGDSTTPMTASSMSAVAG